MSIKLKIGWTDNNIVIEGVKIYKADAEFDQNTLPLPLVEITDGSLFYEDFDVNEDETYFYMLSCFLGDREVFTECYEVLASVDAWVEFDVLKVTALNPEQTKLNFYDNNTYFTWGFFNLDGSKYFTGRAYSTNNAAIQISEFPANNFEITGSTPTIRTIELLIGRYIRSIYFFKNGSYAAITVTKESSIHSLYIVKLLNKFDLNNLEILNESSANASQYCPSENGEYIFEITGGSVNRYDVSGSLLTTFTLQNMVSYTFASISGLTSGTIRSLKISKSGTEVLISYGAVFETERKGILSCKIPTPFDFSEVAQRVVIDRGSTGELSRQNATNRFFYQSYVMWAYATTTINTLYKVPLIAVNWD